MQQAPFCPKPPFFTTHPGRLALGSVLGLCIALGLTFILQLPIKYKIAGVLGLLLPCFAFLSGDVKRFFTVLLIAICIPFSLTQKMIVFPYDDFHITNGIGIGILECTMFLLIALWGLRTVISPEQRNRFSFFSGFSCVSLLYVLVSFLCYIPASDRMLSLFELVKLLKCILIFVWGSQNIRSEHEHRYLIFAILLGANIQSIIVALQSFDIIPVGIEGLTRHDYDVKAYFHDKLYSRPGAILQHSNLLSLYLGMSIPLAFSLLLQSKLNPRVRLYCWFCYLTGVIALVMCFSRAGWLNISLSTATVLALHYRNPESRPQVLRIVTVLSVVLGAFLLYYWTPIYDRLFHSHPEMLTQRWGMNRDAMRMWLDHPVLGVGINNYSLFLPDYWKEGVPLAVHNVYMLHLAEMGPPGLAAYLLLMIMFFRTAFRLTLVKDSFRSSTAIALAGILLGMLADGWFSFGWKWTVISYLFWAEAGLLVSLERCGREEATEIDGGSNPG